MVCVQRLDHRRQWAMTTGPPWPPRSILPRRRPGRVVLAIIALRSAGCPRRPRIRQLHPRSAPAGSTPRAAPLRAPAARRSQEVLRGQGARAALEQRLQRLGRVGDLIGLDDPVMVGIERLEDRRQRWPAVSSRSAGSALPTLAAGAPGPPGPFPGPCPNAAPVPHRAAHRARERIPVRFNL